jgi:AraC-like DNA-binding protein
MNDLQQSIEFQHLIPSLHHIVNRRAHRSWKVERIRKPFHNMMFIAGGEGYTWINGAKHPVKTGMLIYHPVGEEFGYETSQNDWLHCMGGNFSLSQLTPGHYELSARYIDSLPLPRISQPDNGDRLLRLFRDLASAWSSSLGRHHTLKCRSLFMMLLDELDMSLLGKGEEIKHLARIQLAAEYMEKNFTKKMKLGELAELSGLSTSYFGQLFRQAMGETPVEFLHNIRVNHAIQLMGLGCSLEEIAARVGYQDPFYFSRIFKNRKGLSPSAYMKREAYF